MAWLTFSLPLATIVDTVPVPLATKVDRTPSVPLAMIIAVCTNVRGIAYFQIFTPRNPALGARKSAAKELRRLSCVSRRDRIRNDTIWIILQQEQSLVQKIRKRRLTWFVHVTRMEWEWLSLRVLHCHIEGKRSQGRQPKTHITCIKDVAEQDESIQQAVKLAKDRDAWRRLVPASSSSS